MGEGWIFNGTESQNIHIHVSGGGRGSHSALIVDRKIEIRVSFKKSEPVSSFLDKYLNTR